MPACSPSQLRNLDTAAQTPPEDLDLARRGRISTRELARRARGAARQRAAQDLEALRQRQSKAAQKGALLVCAWLQENQIWPAHGENIVDEARRILAGAERCDRLLQCPRPPSSMPLEEIIRLLKPPASIHPDPHSVGWYAAWLARWDFFAFPDSLVRDRALSLALGQQIRGSTPPPKQPRKRKRTSSCTIVPSNSKP